MEILIILALILAGIVLMLVELFLFPGFFVFGLASGGCLAFANYYAFARLGMTEGFLTLAGTGIACILSVVWFMRSKALDKVSLKANITSRIERPAEGVEHRLRHKHTIRLRQNGRSKGKRVRLFKAGAVGAAVLAYALAQPLMALRADFPHKPELFALCIALEKSPAPAASLCKIRAAVEEEFVVAHHNMHGCSAARADDGIARTIVRGACIPGRCGRSG